MRTERVTKWMAAYILVLAMVFIGSQPLKVNATGANEELVWNQNYSATTRNGEINRYSFTLKEMGHIIVRFNTTAPVKLNMIDKKIHKEITHSTYMDAGDEISEYDLKAGDYEFQIVQQNAWEADVTFTAEFSRQK